jgi:hypothetical protein
MFASCLKNEAPEMADTQRMLPIALHSRNYEAATMAFDTVLFPTNQLSVRVAVSKPL